MTNDNDKGKGTTPEATICARCKYMLRGIQKYPLIPHCQANLLTDYVTGELEPQACMFKNKGKCPDYEERD